MEKQLLYYQQGSLGMPPSCHNCFQKFCPLNGLEMASYIQRVLKFIKFEPGETLFFQTGPVNGVFIICQGVVERAYRLTSGKVLLIKFAQPGNWLSEELLAERREYLTFAKTLTRSLVAFISKPDFLELLEMYPILKAYLLKRNCEELCELWKRLTYRAYASPQEQLALTFIALGEWFPSNDTKPISVTLPLLSRKSPRLLSGDGKAVQTGCVLELMHEVSP